MRSINEETLANMARWKYLLVFTGEAPNSFLLNGLEQVQAKLHEQTDVDFQEVLRDQDNWTYDDADDPFCFRSGLGEGVSIEVYRVLNF